MVRIKNMLQFTFDVHVLESKIMKINQGMIGLVVFKSVGVKTIKTRL